MKRFDSLAIREKLIRIIVLISAAVLLPTAVLIAAIDFVLLRQATVRNLGILADAIAYNSSAALAFEDQEDAARVLQALQAEPDVREAVLFDTAGNVFAAYPPRDDIGEGAGEPLPETADNWPKFSEGMLHYLTPVKEGENNFGWLLIRYELRGLWARLFLYLLIIGILTAVALTIAYFLSIVFQSRISGPIIALENVARRVSERHNYSLRATKVTDDEIGSLTQAFNEMLERIATKEAELRLSEERLRVAVEASGTGVWDWDLNSGTAQWVGSLYSSLGLEADASGNSLEHFFKGVHPSEREYVKRQVDEAAKAGGLFEADFRFCAPGGEVRYVRSRGRTFPGKDGAPARMVGVIIDVTDLRLAEAEIRDLNRNLEQRVAERTAELRNALGEIEAFNYSVSHDLRAPLRGINGFSIALLEDYEDKLDDTGKDFLKRIVVSCQRMSQLIDDLLKLSRVTRQEMEKKPVNLSDLARESIQAWRAANPERAVEVRIEDNLQVEGDPRLLSVALDNLLQNAWKFTSKKKEAIIEVGRQTEDSHNVFFVRDNGAGFDMAFSERLFGVFQRLHENRDFEGTGIGLATVRRIIERHGGAVWATGELDRGATFYFTLESPYEPERNPPR